MESRIEAIEVDALIVAPDLGGRPAELAIDLGFRHDIIRDTASFVYGPAGGRVTNRGSARP
ncbi:MAG: hypothetical protein ACRD0A_02060 [Acidimicrobiales bacterium]